MTTFGFNENIPATNNNPSADQPIMQTNNAATKLIIAVDHLTFDSAGSGGAGASAGQHKRVTYNNITAPGAPVNPISIGYTNNSATMAEAVGSATAIAQNFFRNQNGIFPLSCVRAFGNFTSVTVAGVVTANNSFNVSLITATIPGSGTTDSYAIDLIANAVNGNNIMVLAFSNPTGSTFQNQDVRYTFTNPTLTLTISKATARFINFIVLQV